jgi:hypothetical protein
VSDGERYCDRSPTPTDLERGEDDDEDDEDDEAEDDE